jgi:chemotaxis protein MotB
MSNEAPPNKIVPLRPGHPPKPHKKHRGFEEEHGGEDGEGNWIVSYADMMTLLCVFFVLMYSLSTPDPKKYEEVKKQTVQYFGGVYKEPFKELLQKIQAVIQEKGLDNLVKVEADETGVSATFQGTVFFDSGKTELLAQGADTLTKVAAVIKQEAPGLKIVVEGHTDDVPVSTGQFPSNWELSGSRASRVIRMFEQMGFDRKLLTATGLSDTRPLLPNRDAQGVSIPANQAQNRRVILKILREEMPKSKVDAKPDAPNGAAPEVKS